MQGRKLSNTKRYWYGGKGDLAIEAHHEVSRDGEDDHAGTPFGWRHIKVHRLDVIIPEDKVIVVTVARGR